MLCQTRRLTRSLPKCLTCRQTDIWSASVCLSHTCSVSFKRVVFIRSIFPPSWYFSWRVIKSWRSFLSSGLAPSLAHAPSLGLSKDQNFFLLSLFCICFSPHRVWFLGVLMEDLRRWRPVSPTSLTRSVFPPVQSGCITSWLSFLVLITVLLLRGMLVPDRLLCACGGSAAFRCVLLWKRLGVWAILWHTLLRTRTDFL